MPEDTSSPSPTPPASAPPSNPLKRKEPSEDKANSASNLLPAGAIIPPGEYETGRVICEFCGTAVSFRDDDTGEFSLKPWNAHRNSCVAPGSSSAGATSAAGPTVIYTPESTAEALAHPPAKRRRAKRTEEERIDYLRADPYVAQFEAYRVLCASCDKWIRLRPNSTYCSIPWDAHRKSCLAKKINSKNVYALEERNSLFSKDPHIRKFDAERVLCDLCDKWLSVPPDDHQQASEKWLQHRESCKQASTSPIISRTTATSPTIQSTTSAPLASGSSSVHHPTTPSTTSPLSPKPTASTAQSPSAHPLSSFPPKHSTFSHGSQNSPSFHDLTPSNYAPAHESRRRNAEQRAATLRADNLIGEVEPNRVFCSLCEKWVQLRQDSSYCAYPWLQHRGKCLARYTRRKQKAAEVESIKARRHAGTAAHSASASQSQVNVDDDDVMLSEEDQTGSDLESEEGVAGEGSEQSLDIPALAPTGKKVDQESQPRRRPHHQYPSSSLGGGAGQPHGKQKTRYPELGTSDSSRVYTYPPPSSGRKRHHHLAPRQWEEDLDAEGEADAEGDDSYMDTDEQRRRQHPPNPFAHLPRPQPLSVSRSSTTGTGQQHRHQRHRDVEHQHHAHHLLGPSHTSQPLSVHPHRSGQSGGHIAPVRRPHPVGLADLDTPVGRKTFVFNSIEHLFSTTYENTDELTISSLLGYLNSAMPTDKHEDFDTAEVAKAVTAMQEKGMVVIEGDVVRLVE